MGIISQVSVYVALTLNVSKHAVTVASRPELFTDCETSPAVGEVPKMYIYVCRLRHIIVYTRDDLMGSVEHITLEYFEHQK